MKRQLTFPSITTLLRPAWLILVALILGITSANAFFPESPTQLTLIDKNNQQYQSICPELSTLTMDDEKKLLPTPFTLLNWNIYKQQKQQWKNSLQELVNSADLITLQEAKLSDELIQFSHNQHLFYIQNLAFTHNDSIYGVNTLSVAPPTAACGTSYPEPWIWVPKTGIASIYAIQGSDQSLLLINLHGVNFTLTEKPLNEQLSPYLALIETHQGPIVFSGDFNTWTDARLLEVEQSLINSGFSEALFREDKRITVFGLPLDHIYFRGLKVIEARSLATEASDHSPQLVTFDLE